MGIKNYLIEGVLALVKPQWLKSFSAEIIMSSTVIGN